MFSLGKIKCLFMFYRRTPNMDTKGWWSFYFIRVVYKVKKVINCKFCLVTFSGPNYLDLSLETVSGVVLDVFCIKDLLNCKYRCVHAPTWGHGFLSGLLLALAPLFFCELCKKEKAIVVFKSYQEAFICRAGWSRTKWVWVVVIVSYWYLGNIPWF